MLETLVIHAEMAELAHVGAWVDGVAKRLNLPQGMSFAIQLCLEEAIANTVRHGFVGLESGAEPNKDVHLALNYENNAITATIEDHGVAFDPLGVAAPIATTTLAEAAVGGLGVHLIRQFAQHLAYERQGNINRLTLRFDLTRADD
jgi:anti-sigma regulatory factor (Ser/Thr protein kinase)